jgi:hypothetical protein
VARRVWVSTIGVFGSAVGAAAVLVAVRRRARRAGQPRWHAVTVNVPLTEIQELPEPLDTLGESAEVRLREAPGGRGSELAVRWDGVGRAGRRLRESEIRRALRESRQLIEVGEVLRPDSPATTRRTLTSRPLEFATAHGREGGRL